MGAGDPSFVPRAESASCSVGKSDGCAPAGLRFCQMGVLKGQGAIHLEEVITLTQVSAFAC